MLKEILYETPIEKVDFKQPSIFLAGPTVRGHQTHLISWRNEAAELFKQKRFEGNLIIPEFTDKTESDKYRYDIPVWEFGGLTNSHVIMFWIPRTRELIGLTTNHEHGYWMGRDRSKMVYGRPDDAYRMTYLDIMWVEDAKRTGAKCPIYNKLEKTVDASLKLIKTLYKKSTKSYWVNDDGKHCPICGVGLAFTVLGPLCSEHRGGCGKWCDGSANLTEDEAKKHWSKIIH